MLNGIVSEVPYEVLFCHAIASGDLSRAQALYPYIDLFKRYDLGITPALFCSWAAYKNEPEAAIQILHEYFPDLSHYDSDLLDVDITQTLLQVVLPKETSSSSWVASLLMNISAVDPLIASGDQKKQQFVFDCCVAALKFILDINNRAFDGISPKTRDLAQKLLHWLKPFTENEKQIHSEPASLQNLMGLLGNTQAEARFLNLYNAYPRTYLISKGPLSSSVEQATHALKTCRQECENENLALGQVPRLVN